MCFAKMEEEEAAIEREEGDGTYHFIQKRLNSPSSGCARMEFKNQ